METYIPGDIGKIENRILLGLTARQLFYFGIGAVFAVPVFFISKSLLGITSASALTVFSLLPFFFFAMYEKGGQTAEKIIRNMIKQEFIRPKERPYISKCIYSAAIRQAELEKEVFIICREK